MEDGLRARVEGIVDLAQLEHAQLALLQRLSERLGGLTRPNEVASTVLDHAAHALQASSGSLCLSVEDGKMLEFAAHYGYPDSVATDWGRFSVDLATPAGECVRSRSAIYLSRSEMLDRFPLLVDRPRAENDSLALLPLVVRETDLLGVLVLGFANRREFSPNDQMLLSAIANQAATALDRATTRLALDEERHAAELRQAQLAFLAEASDALSRSLELSTVLSTIAELAVPRIADRCLLYLNEGKSVVQSMLAPEPTEEELALLAHFAPAPQGVAAVLAGGEALHLSRVDIDPAKSDVNAQLARVGIGGVLVLPMVARGHRLGALAFVNRAGRILDESDRLLAEELSARASMALDNAQLFARESEVAHKLARSLLPGNLPSIDGLELAARYEPGGTGFEVGGDFYDCVAVADDAYLIVVGDVQGRGIEAAALTGLARYTIQSYATVDPRPKAVLAHLNGVLVRRALAFDSADLDLERPRFCTAMLMLVERADDGFLLRVASGGHPLPLLRRLDGEVVELGSYGMMLGCSEKASYVEVGSVLRPGELVVSVTDGVTERRTPAGLLGTEGVSALVATGPARPEELAEALVNEARNAAADDVVVVVAAAS